MLRFALFLTFGLLAFSSHRADATWYGQSFEYNVAYHFNGVAWGKQVKTVYVHTGALIELRDYNSDQVRTRWEDVKHIQMEYVNDHFEAATVIIATEGGGTGSEYSINKGPVVQYWVTFVDGSSVITDTVAIPVLDAEPGSIRQTFSILTGIRSIPR
jgi:hypothetical protein